MHRSGADRVQPDERWIGGLDTDTNTDTDTDTNTDEDEDKDDAR